MYTTLWSVLGTLKSARIMCHQVSSNCVEVSQFGKRFFCGKHFFMKQRHGQRELTDDGRGDRSSLALGVVRRGRRSAVHRLSPAFVVDSAASIRSAFREDPSPRNCRRYIQSLCRGGRVRSGRPVDATAHLVSAVSHASPLAVAPLRWAQQPRTPRAAHARSRTVR